MQPEESIIRKSFEAILASGERFDKLNIDCRGNLIIVYVALGPKFVSMYIYDVDSDETIKRTICDGMLKIQQSGKYR